MNRIPILAGGAVLAAVVLCGGAVTVANAVSSTTPSSQVLSISGVTTAHPSSSPTAAEPSGTPTPSATAEPGDDNGGVTVVTPSDPTKIGGKGCDHLGKHGADDPADHDATDDNGRADGGATGDNHQGENEPGHHEFLPGTGSQSGPGNGGGFGGGGHHSGEGSGHH